MQRNLSNGNGDEKERATNKKVQQQGTGNKRFVCKIETMSKSEKLFKYANSVTKAFIRCFQRIKTKQKANEKKRKNY